MKNLSHRSDAVLVVLMIAAFGPYVIAGSVRTEHLVIYPFFAISLAIIALGAPSVLRLRPVGDLRLLLLLIFMLVATVTMLLRNYQSPRHLLGSVENYLQPLAVITIVGTTIAGRNETDLRRLAIRLIGIYIALLMVNSAIAAGALGLKLSGRGDLVSSLLRPFWGNADVGQLTTAEKAMVGFRFSGIFDQPYEAGLHHSFGLLLIVFVIRLEDRVPMIGDYLRLIVIAIGGLLSLSKVIVFGGLPFLIVYLLWEKWLGKFFRSKFMVALIMVGIIVGGSAISWFIDQIGETWTPGNIIRTLIGARFLSAESPVLIVAREVLASSPLIGLGYGAFTTYDNAYVEYWAQGGVFALLFYVLILAILAGAGIRERRTSHGRFYAVVTLFVTLAGIGAPILTANRFTVVFWMLMTILLTRDALRRQLLASSQAISTRGGTPPGDAIETEDHQTQKAPPSGPPTEP